MTTTELTVARTAAEAAGTILMRYFDEGVTMRNKDVGNLVSDADIEAEHTVVDIIRRSYPGHEILGEEVHQGNVDAEHLWVIDPLDGTNNFAHKIPHFAVSIAYYRAGVAQCGVIFNPARGDWYTTARGQGSALNGRSVRVSDETRLDETIVGLGFYYNRGAMMEATLKAIGDLKRQRVHGTRRMGTASLDLCMVGSGLYGAYFEYELSPWDFAAGRLFVEEAGGKVTNCQGEPLKLARSSVLSSNGALHEAVLAIVRGYKGDLPGG